MNQGDQDHVIVVTGCDPCVAPGAQILPSANFSPTFVHVAAPAADVVSTVWGTKYAAAKGTSQATAFAAGLASAMVARYPVTYKFAWHVKERLQVTSMPIELIGVNRDDARKLAAGIIDPAMATRDPNKEWLKVTGGDPTGYTQLTWNVDTLTMTFDSGSSKRIDTEEIWRLVTRGSKSVIYIRGPVPGSIQKLGPGTLSVPDPTRPILTVDANAVKLGVIEDLLLKAPKAVR
jgi:subtilisin family serine protease